MEMIRAGGSVGIIDKCSRVEMDEEGYEYDVPGDTELDETMISQIYVSYDGLIRSIQFGYLENGALLLSTKYGSSEGHSFPVVRLNQDEYVTGLSGALGLHGGFRNLTLDMMKLISMRVVQSRDRREFGGFFGSYASGGLTSIGIYVNPIVISDTVVKPENI